MFSRYIADELSQRLSPKHQAGNNLYCVEKNSVINQRNMKLKRFLSLHELLAEYCEMVNSFPERNK